MTMLFEEDKRRLGCVCGNSRLYKRDVFTYLRSTSDKNAVEEHLLETEIRCERCNKVIHVIKPRVNKVLS